MTTRATIPVGRIWAVGYNRASALILLLAISTFESKPLAGVAGAPLYCGIPHTHGVTGSLLLVTTFAVSVSATVGSSVALRFDVTSRRPTSWWSTSISLLLLGGLDERLMSKCGWQGGKSFVASWLPGLRWFTDGWGFVKWNREGWLDVVMGDRERRGACRGLTTPGSIDFFWIVVS